MKVYMGFRLAGICHVYRWDANQPARPVRLDMRLDLWSHSPSGYEWGYQGSGPAQLALALAADALGDGERAVAIHQELKRYLVTDLPRECWSITRDRLCEIICDLEEVRNARKEGVHGE